MGVAAIALLGALLGPQDLAATWTPASWSPSALDSSALANVVAGVGASALSLQTLNASVSQVSLSGPANGQVNLRTGDITLDASASSGFAGIQAINLNTGFGSSSQAAVSIAAGGLTMGARP